MVAKAVFDKLKAMYAAVKYATIFDREVDDLMDVEMVTEEGYKGLRGSSSE